VHSRRTCVVVAVEGEVLLELLSRPLFLAADGAEVAQMGCDLPPL
jgi:hypothetical protein